MNKYQGKISGVGNATTRKNEITADDLTISRNYIYGWEYGVVNREGWNFSETHDKNSVTIEKGIMFAYGYFGIFPKTYTIPFIKPSTTQYRFIYAEIDRGVVPNTCTIKVKNNQGSDKIKPTTFRQDYLTAIRTGVFQLPLWRVELNNEGVVNVVDVRDLRNYIMKVKHSNYTTNKVTGEISPLAIATTQPITDNSEKLATTEFVHLATRNYIDNNGIKPYVAKVQINVIKGTSDKNEIYFTELNSTQYFTITGNSRYDIYQENISVDDNIELSLFSQISSQIKTFSIKLKEIPLEYTTYTISARCVH